MRRATGDPSPEVDEPVARLLTSMLGELERREGRYGLQVMCEGGGQANVTILERLG